jgi:hypothetical protein
MMPRRLVLRLLVDLVRRLPGLLLVPWPFIAAIWFTVALGRIDAGTGVAWSMLASFLAATISTVGLWRQMVLVLPASARQRWRAEWLFATALGPLSLATAKLVGVSGAGRISPAIPWDLLAVSTLCDVAAGAALIVPRLLIDLRLRGPRRLRAAATRFGAVPALLIVLLHTMPFAAREAWPTTWNGLFSMPLPVLAIAVLFVVAGSVYRPPAAAREFARSAAAVRRGQPSPRWLAGGRAGGVWLLLSKEALIVLAMACVASSVMAVAHSLHAPSGLLWGFGQGLLFSIVAPPYSFQAHMRQLRLVPIGSFQLQLVPLAAALLRCGAFAGTLNLSLMATGGAPLSSYVTLALIGALVMASAIRLRWPSGVRSFAYLIPVPPTVVLTTTQPAWTGPAVFIAVGLAWLTVAIALNYDTLIRRGTTYRARTESFGLPVGT